MKDLDHIILGALLHDIGKFWKRANHPEITNTQQFCEQLRQQISALATDQPPLWQQLATGNGHQRLQKIVDQAGHFAHAQHESKQTSESPHLASLLERVSLPKPDSLDNHQNSRKNYQYQHPLVALGLDEEQIYPRTGTLPGSYQELGKALVEQLDRLPKIIREDSASIRGLVHNLLALFERYLVNIPAGPSVASETFYLDISLFDQLRITAAIAEGLYRYHEDKGDLTTANFADTETVKWLLVCGDFSGIQKFIYNLTQKGAAKGLRGRSLYIQLLCDAVSQFILQELELYFTARIYSSGGKFYLLIAKGQESSLRQIVNKVNDWLFKEFQGQVFLGIGIAEVCGKHFEMGEMGEKWKEANESLQKNRLQPFVSKIKVGTQLFEVQPLTPSKYAFCHVCGRDDHDVAITHDDEHDRNLCLQCEELEKLGKTLANTKGKRQPGYFLWVWGDGDRQILRQYLKEIPSCCFHGLDCELYVLDQYPQLDQLGQAVPHTLLERVNDPDCLDRNPHGYRCGFRFIGQWDKDKDARDWQFDEFADKATGIKRLGILRMDVDNLGQLFSCGLPLASLSRVATLSRQLNLFFGGHLNRLLTPFQRSQIIYAGGDDVFIIGAWDELPDVAWCIRQKFGEYCANNPSFTLSGGMVMVGGTYPISIAAEEAGEAESQAKHLKTKTTAKDAFCFLDTAIPWQMYESMKKVRNLIIEIIDCSDGSRAIIDRLRIVVLSLQEFQRRWETPEKNLSEVRELAMYHKWRWQLVYNLARMTNRYPKAKPLIEELQQILFENKIKGENEKQFELMSLLPLWLPLPVRWAELLTRKSKDVSRNH